MKPGKPASIKIYRECDRNKKGIKELKQNSGNMVGNKKTLCQYSLLLFKKIVFKEKVKVIRKKSSLTNIVLLIFDIIFNFSNI